jgi:hypothetical protein
MPQHQHIAADEPTDDDQIPEDDFVTEVLTYLIILDHDEDDA